MRGSRVSAHAAGLSAGFLPEASVLDAAALEPRVTGARWVWASIDSKQPSNSEDTAG